MKRIFHAALVLPLVLFAVSCGESNNDGVDNPVKLSPETKPEQQLYADDEQAPAPIKFTAKALWTATVTEMATKVEGGSEVDWLTLSAYKGDAGEVALTMELKKNTTGQHRKAEIRILCDGTTTKITVEQKSTKQDGTIPEPENSDKPTGYSLVERIDVRFQIGCEEIGASYEKANYYTFHYDNQNRIAEYQFAEYDNIDGTIELDYKCTTRFDYTVQGEIRLTENTTYNTNSDDEPRTDTYRVLLDEWGRATQITKDRSSHNDAPITYGYSYNDEGRLSRMSWYEYIGSSTESYETLTYGNGVLSEIEYDFGKGEDGEIFFSAYAFSDRPNDRLNIDPNWLMFKEPAEPQWMLPMLRLAGKGCDRLALWLPHYNEVSYPTPVVPGYPNPNVTIHKTYDYYEHEKTDPLQYTFNDDGTIASIVQPIVCIQMRHEYDIVVGDEPVYPENSVFKYKYTIENDKTYEIKRSTDKHEWTFTYRQ
ncbi:MAG: hypothetical protein NC250_05155 [Alistipes senegalensis]|nr:hypothetical protein [Bacteroides cellulosilyticus]MCM1352098.1 hypothetical protein [Alistipes senegalensis]